MKKALIVISLSIFLVSMPSFAALSIPRLNKANENLLNLSNKSLNKGDIPNWADGRINGTWGMREFSLLIGMVEIEIGNITGYYGNIFGSINYFQGKFSPFFNENIITNITGFSFGSVIFGYIGDVDLETELYKIKTNESNYVGIGGFNESNFDWRIMSWTGPTFFIKGTFDQL